MDISSTSSLVLSSFFCDHCFHTVKSHPGNRPYWIRILESRPAYRYCESDAGKCHIAEDILDFVKCRGGRFLNLDDETKRWFLLPDSVVLDKIKQALRDRYVPFWAKDMEIKPLVIDATAYSGRTLPITGINTDRQQRHPMRSPEPGGASTTPAIASDSTLQRHQYNNLDFLVAASRAFAGAPAAEAIPSVDDILKLKIDTLPAFDKRQRAAVAAAAAAAAVNTPLMQSLGMGNFYSVDFMSSLGGGAGSLATGNIGGNVVNTTTMSSAMGSLGGAIGGPFGATMAGNFGSTAAMNPAAASFALRSRDWTESLDRFMDNQQFNAATAGRSLDFMTLMASHGGLGSFGGVGGFHLPPVPAGGMDSSTGVGGSAAAAAASVGSSSSSSGKNGASKTDWNAMYAKAIGNSKAI